MSIRNEIALTLSALLLGAMAQAAHGASPPNQQSPAQQEKQLREQIADAKRKPYRHLTSEEIKQALALPIKDQATAAFLGNPGFKTIAPLPPGVALQPDGYLISAVVGDTTYSFLNTESPLGKELLFKCGHGLPWWGWIEAPGLCGIAVIDVPAARAAQLKQASRLNGMNAQLGDEERETPAGKAFMSKIEPLFALVLRRCSTVAPPTGSTYAWFARLSTKGKIVKSRVMIRTARNGAMYVDESPYFNCVDEAMKNQRLPEPTFLPGAVFWLGGFPAAFYWTHDKEGDRIRNH
jgi:hypothetical protein